MRSDSPTTSSRRPRPTSNAWSTASSSPRGVSRRVFDALARVFEIPRSQLEGAGDLSRWLPAPAPAAAPVFRADKDAARAVGAHLDVLADALQAPGDAGRDEVDDLFLGGR